MMDSPISPRSFSSSRFLDPLETNTAPQDQPRSISSPTTRPVDIMTRRIGSGGSLRSRRGLSASNGNSSSSFGGRNSLPHDHYTDSVSPQEDSLSSSYYIADRLPGSPSGPCLILRSPRTSLQRNTSTSSLGADDLHLSDNYYTENNNHNSSFVNSAADAGVHGGNNEYPHPSDSPRLSSPATPTTTTTYNIDEKTGEEYVEHALPMVECPKDVHAALMDRPLEMKELLEFNTKLASTIKLAMGEATYDKAVNLWCQTRRDKMSDLEWLCRSKLLFNESGAGDLWTEWSQMIGYENDLELEFDPEAMHQRQMPLGEIMEEEE